MIQCDMLNMLQLIVVLTSVHKRQRQPSSSPSQGLRYTTIIMTVTLNLDALATDSSTRRTLSDISLSVAKSKKIVVVTGAGISCSCGIPVGIIWFRICFGFSDPLYYRTFDHLMVYMRWSSNSTQTLFSKAEIYSTRLCFETRHLHLYFTPSFRNSNNPSTQLRPPQPTASSKHLIPNANSFAPTHKTSMALRRGLGSWGARARMLNLLVKGRTKLERKMSRMCSCTVIFTGCGVRSAQLIFRVRGNI